MFLDFKLDSQKEKNRVREIIVYETIISKLNDFCVYFLYFLGDLLSTLENILFFYT